MLVKYVPTTGITGPQFLSDVKLLLTGTTDINALSASCNKGSTIFSGSPGEWTLEDDVVPGNLYGDAVISGNDIDGTGVKKVYRLNGNSTPGIATLVMTAWNPTTDVGTNVSATALSTLVVSSARTYFIGSDGQSFFYIANNLGQAIMGVEVLRDTEVLQQHPSTGYPPVGVAYGTTGETYIPPNSIRNPLNASSFLSYNSTAVAPFGYGTSGGAVQWFAGDGTPYIPTAPLILSTSTKAFLGRIRGNPQSGPTPTGWTMGDTILINGIQYMLLGVQNSSYVAFPIS